MDHTSLLTSYKNTALLNEKFKFYCQSKSFSNKIKLKDRSSIGVAEMYPVFLEASTIEQLVAIVNG